MKGWLLDTDVVEQLAPEKKPRLEVEPSFSNWLRLNTDDLYLSATTIADIARAIELIHRAGHVEKAAQLRVWLEDLIANYGARILHVSAVVGIVVGELVRERVANIKSARDSAILIGGTTRAFGLGLLTRGKANYEWMNGFPRLDPFVDPLPE